MVFKLKRPHPKVVARVMKSRKRAQNIFPFINKDTIKFIIDKVESSPLWFALSAVVAQLYCVASFRELPIAGPLKLIPVGILSVFSFMGKHADSKDSVAHGSLALLSFGMLLHSFGDSFLHSTHAPLHQAALVFGSGWLCYLLFMFGFLFQEDKISFKFSKTIMVSLMTAWGLIISGVVFSGVSIYAKAAIGAYIILEILNFAASFMLQENLMMMGMAMYLMSDLGLITGASFVVTWPMYYLGQVLICMGGIRKAEKYGKMMMHTPVKVSPESFPKGILEVFS